MLLTRPLPAPARLCPLSAGMGLCLQVLGQERWAPALGAALLRTQTMLAESRQEGRAVREPKLRLAAGKEFLQEPLSCWGGAARLAAPV